MGFFENPVLSSQVVDDILLLSVDPAGEKDDEKMPGLHDRFL